MRRAGLPPSWEEGTGLSALLRRKTPWPRAATATGVRRPTPGSRGPQSHSASRECGAFWSQASLRCTPVSHVTYPDTPARLVRCFRSHTYAYYLLSTFSTCGRHLQPLLLRVSLARLDPDESAVCAQRAQATIPAGRRGAAEASRPNIVSLKTRSRRFQKITCDPLRNHSLR